MKIDKNTGAVQFTEKDLKKAGVDNGDGTFKVTVDDVNLFLRSFNREAKQKAKLDLLYDAIRDAEDWQLSIADAWSNKGPQAEKALKKVEKYKKLRQEIADALGISMKSALEIEIENADLKSIHELKNMKPLKVTWYCHICHVEVDRGCRCKICGKTKRQKS